MGAARSLRRSVNRGRQVEPTNAAAVAAIDQLAARVAEQTGADLAVVAKVAPALLRAGAEAQLDAVIRMLEHDCKTFVDTQLVDEQRIGGHQAVGQMVARLKILRRMTEGN